MLHKVLDCIKLCAKLKKAAEVIKNTYSISIFKTRDRNREMEGNIVYSPVSTNTSADNLRVYSPLILQLIILEHLIVCYLITQVRICWRTATYFHF